MLILAVVTMILIVIAALLLFDVQTVIRGKVKAQSGVDAAALTAAEWQKHSLNVIGELNLYRATGALLTDPYFGMGVLKNPNSNDGDLYTGLDGIPKVKLKTFGRFEDAGEYFHSDGTFIPIEIDEETGQAVVTNWKMYDDFISELIRIEKERRYLIAIDELISQMQTRLAFAGPMIAFGAAQQAARNNGLTYSRDASRTFDIYHDIVSGQNPLGEILTQHRERFKYSYAWRGPYLSMLESAIGYDYSPTPDRGFGPAGEYRSNICVGTNFTFSGMPELVSDTSSTLTYYLGHSETYMDILHKNWLNLAPLLEYDLPENWWNDLRRNVRDEFSYQSEILPLHIEISHSQDPYDEAAELGAFDKYDRWKQGIFSDHYNDIDPVEYNADVEITETEESGRLYRETRISLGPVDYERFFIYHDEDADMGYNLLPELSWALFDSEWETYSDKKRNTWENEMLRSRFKDGMDYQSGARAYFNAEQTTATLTGSMGRPRRNRYEQNAADVFIPTMASYDAKQVSDMLHRLESSGFLPKIQTDALAKPTGVLKLKDGSRLRPFEAGRMILPVFDDTAMIPVSLEEVESMSDDGSFNSSWLYYLLDFVPELSGSPTIPDAMERAVEKHPDRWGHYMPYYLALLILNDPGFREEGKEWLEEWREKHKDDDNNSNNNNHNNSHHGGGGGGSGGGGGGGGSSGSGSSPGVTEDDDWNEFKLH